MSFAPLDEEHRLEVFDTDDLASARKYAREAGATFFAVTRGECANVVFWVGKSDDTAPMRNGLVLVWPDRQETKEQQ